MLVWALLVWALLVWALLVRGYVSLLSESGVALIRTGGSSGNKSGLEGYQDMDHIGSERHVKAVAMRMEQQLQQNQNPK